MRFIFELLKLFESFRKLLNEHFESERKELQEQVERWQKSWQDTNRDMTEQAKRAAAVEHQAYLLNSQVNELQGRIENREREIERLQNATTAKLKAVDDLDSESVFNATLYSPRTTPRD